MNDEDRILEDIKEILKELMEQGRMKYTQRYMQHSDISVYKHCISVAYTSVVLVERFSLNVNRKELIRGALLHDYFLYDWAWKKMRDTDFTVLSMQDVRFKMQKMILN